MQRELDDINAKMDAGERVANLVQRKHMLECKLKDIYIRETKGAQLRSKALYIEKGEISYGYFKGLEKSHQSKNLIECIQTENGNKVTESNLILSECCNFYQRLYKKQDIDIVKMDEYLDKTDMPKLNENEKQACDAKLTEREVANAIVSLKTDKSPGLNGLSPEFYMKHWNELCKPFMQVIREAYRKGELPVTMNQSVVTLIFKERSR